LQSGNAGGIQKTKKNVNIKKFFYFSSDKGREQSLSFFLKKMRNWFFLNILALSINTMALCALLYNYQQYKSAVFELKDQALKSLQAVESLSNEISSLVGGQVNSKLADAIKVNVQRWWKK
jgi:Trk-type K+ transport system membrane component